MGLRRETEKQGEGQHQEGKRSQSSQRTRRKRSLDNEGALTLLSLAIREGEYVL